jgi:hypothetical protein
VLLATETWKKQPSSRFAEPIQSVAASLAILCCVLQRHVAYVKWLLQEISSRRTDCYLAQNLISSNLTRSSMLPQ